MKRITSLMLSLLLSLMIISEKSMACTNFLITKGSNQRRFNNDLLFGRLTRSLW